LFRSIFCLTNEFRSWISWARLYLGFWPILELAFMLLRLLDLDRLTALQISLPLALLSTIDSLNDSPYSCFIYSHAWLFSSRSFFSWAIWESISSARVFCFESSISWSLTFEATSSYEGSTGDWTWEAAAIVFLRYSSYDCLILRSRDPKCLSLFMISLNV
jgi:hypothetical protein